MKVTIPAKILQRFIALSYLKIEITDGKIYLIGTNEKFACVQYLGTTKDPEDSCYINNDKSLKEVVDKESGIAGSLTFDTIPELATGSVVDTLGQVYTDFVYWPDESILNNWYNWFELSTEQNGFLYFDIVDIETLWRVSPSGELVFPEVIDANKPVIIRDVNDNNWIGVFIPSIEGKRILKPATLPEWL